MMSRWSGRIQRLENKRQGVPVALVATYDRGRGFCETCQSMKPAPAVRKKGWTCKDCREKSMSTQTEPTFQITRSQYKAFLQEMVKNPKPGLRLGQAFFNYFSLGKMTSAANKDFADKIHAASGDEAVKLMLSIIDDTN